MFEAFFLAALVFIVVLALRSKKSVVLENPLIIHKVGLFHATLSPQLGSAQALLEQIASLYVDVSEKPVNIAAQYFAMHDANGAYLLAVGLRSGLLYFQAIQDVLPGERSAAIRNFSEQVMVLHPLSALPDEKERLALQAIVMAAAKKLSIACFVIH